MPKIDLKNKVADWVDCPRCWGNGCSECDWRGSVLVKRGK